MSGGAGGAGGGGKGETIISYFSTLRRPRCARVLSLNFAGIDQIATGPVHEMREFREFLRAPSDDGDWPWQMRDTR